MKNITYRLKVVSPLYLGGAESGMSEERAPSLKGALRFWFRAMMGGIVPDIEVKELKHLEGNVFGDTDGASFQVRFRVIASEETLEENQGVRYLRGMGVRGRAPFNVGSDVEVSFRFFHANVLFHQCVYGSLWLLLYMGGLGSRSRRTFGTLRLKGEDPTPAYDAYPEGTLSFRLPEKFEEIQQYYQKNLEFIERVFKAYSKFSDIPGKRIKSIFPEEKGDGEKTLPEFSCLKSGCWQMAIVTDPAWTDIWSTLNALGGCLQGFRRRGGRNDRTADYMDYVSRFIPSRKEAVGGGEVWKPDPIPGSWNLKNDALGLPYQIRSRSRSLRVRDPRRGPNEYKTLAADASLIWTADSADFDNQNASKPNRRSSPLTIRPLQLTESTFAAIFIILQARFLPEHARLWLTNAGPGQWWREMRNQNKFPREFNISTYCEEIAPVTVQDLDEIVQELQVFLRDRCHDDNVRLLPHRE